MDKMVNDLQIQNFLNDDCFDYFLELTANQFKEAIVNCAPHELDKREHAYFMYHAVQSLKSEMDKERMRLFATALDSQ